MHISVFSATEYPQLISTTAMKDMNMIGYASLGTANLSRAESFYDALLAEFGAKQVMHMDDFIVWAVENGGAAFSIHVPENGKEYSVGNGVMIALAASGQTQVNLVHEKVLKLGGVDEGKPGFRAEGFYAAYFRDLDGNKLNVHCMVS
ncbi:VOC family protein [Shinella sp.]|uniref:VOC family protein n=1 Tax=Shinella sp. TaxID=1870904 RepID=UPI0040359053